MDSDAPGQLIIGFSLVGLLNDAAIEGLVWTLIGMLWFPRCFLISIQVVLIAKVLIPMVLKGRDAGQVEQI